jgi:hypothetical protein
VQICNVSGWTYIIGIHMESAIYLARGKKNPRCRYVIYPAEPAFFILKINQWPNPILQQYYHLWYTNGTQSYAIYPARPAFLVSSQCPAKFPITLQFPAGFAFLRRLMQQYILNFRPKVQNAHPQSIFRPTGDHPRFHSTRDIVCLSADP